MENYLHQLNCFSEDQYKIISRLLHKLLSNFLATFGLSSNFWATYGLEHFFGNLFQSEKIYPFLVKAK